VEHVLNDLVDMLVPISGCVMIAAIVIVPLYFKSIERQKLAETVRIAIEKGQPLPPEVIMTLTSAGKPARTPERDLRRGLLLVAVALGTVGLGLALGVGDASTRYALVGSAAFPGFIGLAFIAIWFLGKPRS
jgi:hypothetical protein